MSPDARVRRDLAACHRLVAHLGWTDLVHTHLSARRPSHPEHVLLTPYGRDFAAVQASELVTVALDGSLVDDPTGRGVHPAARGVHLPLYVDAPDRHAVLHTHTVAGIAVSAQTEGLRRLSQHALRFHGRLARHRYGGIALHEAEGVALARDLGPHQAMLLDHHGLLTCGPSIADAFDRMHFLETACRIQVAIGTAPCQEIPEALAEATARQFERPGRDAPEVFWAMWLERLAADR